MEQDNSDSGHYGFGMKLNPSTAVFYDAAPSTHPWSVWAVASRQSGSEVSSTTKRVIAHTVTGIIQPGKHPFASWCMGLVLPCINRPARTTGHRKPHLLELVSQGRPPSTGDPGRQKYWIAGMEYLV